jgi:hypothetical protein
LLKLEPVRTLTDVLDTLSIPPDFYIALVKAAGLRESSPSKEGDPLVLFTRAG